MPNTNLEFLAIIIGGITLPILTFIGRKNIGRFLRWTANNIIHKPIHLLLKKIAQLLAPHILPATKANALEIFKDTADLMAQELYRDNQLSYTELQEAQKAELQSIQDNINIIREKILEQGKLLNKDPMPTSANDLTQVKSGQIFPKEGLYHSIHNPNKLIPFRSGQIAPPFEYPNHKIQKTIWIFIKTKPLQPLP